MTQREIAPDPEGTPVAARIGCRGLDRLQSEPPQTANENIPCVNTETVC